MAFHLPRSIVLAPQDNTKYLSYFREGGDTDGFLKFFETQAVSPYATFDVETSCKKVLVHIRSRQSNKYWERIKKVSDTAEYWVAATAENKEDDQSKESWTLFKFIPAEGGAKTVHIVHFQSGCNLCLWEGSDPALDRCVSAKFREYDGRDNDIFKIIDCKSLLVLPKYVALKGFNNMYLGIEGNEVAYSADDLGNPDVAWATVFQMKEPCASNPLELITFGGLSRRGESSLFSLENNKFCSKTKGSSSGIWYGPNAETINKEARLTLKEPVLSVDIYDVTYHLHNSRVYDQTTFMVAKNYASNYTDEQAHTDVKITYENVTTSVWKRNFSASLRLEAKTEFNIPFVADRGVELSAEFHDETKTRKPVTDVVHKVIVPAMTKVTVNLIATRAKCDVPFSFMQSATLYDGTISISEVEGAVYAGSNYYSIHFETEHEKLMPKPKKTELW
ncbi:hypothetical protein V6N13_047290 [Hibiscus sabdariffa]|uniref:Agglutinin domain-containing protein n=1 Tax=Hibiscus sabdariffa TaxID=183260 RepID=A0ABR2F3N1_9ROSI